MPHDIESNFTEEYWNEEKQCHLCDSLEMKDEKCYCCEFEIEVPPVAHCDFFRSKD